MPNPIIPLIAQLENPSSLNLDELLAALREASRSFDDYHTRAVFYERELQAELKALIELAGPIPRCLDPKMAATLTADALLLARRAARKQFNDVFHITPVRRS
jgi:hypothetical protein